MLYPFKDYGRPPKVELIGVDELSALPKYVFASMFNLTFVAGPA